MRMRMRMSLVAGCSLVLGCSLDTSGFGMSGTGDTSETGAPNTTSASATTAESESDTVATGGGTAVESTSADGTTSGPGTATSATDDTGSEADDTTEGECDEPSTACLVDRGLLARYFLDEAESGDGPSDALDSAPDPLPLPIDWTDNMNYVTQDGNTGLEWESAGGSGSAFISVAGTKLAMIDGQTSATIEAVIEVRGVTNGSRVVNFGEGSEGGLFTFRLRSTDEPRLWWNHETVMGWWNRELEETRAVVHIVFDSTEDAPDDRRRLYVDGQLVEPPGGNAPPRDQPIDLFLGDPEFSLGNRANGGRSMDGILFYAALYTEALTQEEIYRNTAILEIDDDRP